MEDRSPCSCSPGLGQLRTERIAMAGRNSREGVPEKLPGPVGKEGPVAPYSIAPKLERTVQTGIRSDDGLDAVG